LKAPLAAFNWSRVRFHCDPESIQVVFRNAIVFSFLSPLLREITESSPRILPAGVRSLSLACPRAPFLHHILSSTGHELITQYHHCDPLTSHLLTNHKDNCPQLIGFALPQVAQPCGRGQGGPLYQQLSFLVESRISKVITSNQPD
jgi:hypothetical protein